MGLKGLCGSAARTLETSMGSPHFHKALSAQILCGWQLGYLERLMKVSLTSAFMIVNPRNAGGNAYPYLSVHGTTQEAPEGSWKEGSPLWHGWISRLIGG